MKRIVSFLLAILMLVSLIPADLAYAMEGEKLETVLLSDGQYMIKLPGVDYTSARQAPVKPDINPTDNPREFSNRTVTVDIDDMVLDSMTDKKTGEKVENVTITVTCTQANYSKEYVLEKKDFGENGGIKVPVPKAKYNPAVFVKFFDSRDSRYLVEAHSVPNNVVNITIQFLGHTGVATRWFGTSSKPEVKANFIGINNTDHKFDLPKTDQNTVLRSPSNTFQWRGHDNLVLLPIVPQGDIQCNDMGTAEDIHLEIQNALQGKLADSKYYFQITGESYTHRGFTATMREKHTVDFDAGDGTWKTAKPAKQFAANGLKLNETFMDAPDTIGPVTVPNGESDLTPPKSKADEPENVFKGWATTANGTVVDMATYVVEGDTTFHAIYGPKDQGKVTIQYVDEQGTAINDKYKIANQSYPAEATGNVDENVDASKIPEPKFIGYERNGNIDVTDKKYLKNGGHTVEVPYKKLDPIIPEDKASEDVKKTYTKVTFAADAKKGTLKLGSNAGGNEKVYYVNPVEGKSIEDVRTVDNITAEGKKDVYKVDENTPWTFVPDEVSSLGTVITTVPVTVNANFVKEKGTVTYEYKYVNNTTITDPSKTGIPAVPTDNKEYEVETTVKAETTVAKDKTVPVKDNSGNTIGNWKFSGWTPAELEVKKNSEENKNKFTGTWTFTEAGKHGVTYKFTDENGNNLPPESGELNKFPAVPTDANTYYVDQDITLPTTPAVNTEVKGTNGNKQGTWKFLGWFKGETKLTEATVKAADSNEFVGKWKFEEAGKGYVKFEFKAAKGTLPKEVTDIQDKLNEELKNEKHYVDEKVTPKALSKTSVDGKNGNKEGKWTTDWTPSEITIGEGENKVEVTWTFEPAKEGKVTYKFIIKEGVVPNDYDLDKAPFNALKDKLEPKTAYVGRKVTAPEINQTFKENITFKEGEKNVEKQGTWKFEPGWDEPSKDMVEDGITFTGTWTWKQEQSKKPEVNEPKKGDKVITGKGEPESVIEVEIPNPKDPTNPKKVTTTVGDDGKWTVDIPEAKEGDEYNVTQTEKGKTPSEKVTVKVKDKVKPEPKPEPTPVPEVEIPGIKYKDHYTPTYPVYVSVPDKKDPVQDIFTHEQYIFGYPDDTIRPDGDMTRAEAIAVVARLQKLDLSDKTSNIYKDTKAGMWYNAAINAAFREGYLLEKEGENIRPNDKITRAELALLISHIDKKNDKVAPFEDVKGHKFEAAINQAYGNERIKGYPDGTFKPDNSITRAEVATMLNKLYDRYPDKNFIDANQNLVHNYKDMSYKGHWGYYELVEAYHTHKFARLANNMEEWKAIIK